MYKILCAAALVVISGCTTVAPTFGPDGRAAFTLDCSGTMQSWGGCHKKAGNLCKERGYDTIYTSGERGRSTTAAAGDGSAWLFASSLHFRTITVSCK